VKTAVSAPAYSYGTIVRIRVVPLGMKHRLSVGDQFRVVDTTGHTYPGVELLRLAPEGRDGDTLADFPGSFVEKVAAPKRRSPLNLHAPKDTRSEAERQAECLNWLRNAGFLVLEIGQGRKGQKCDECGHFQVPRGYMGTTPGTPDSMVTSLTWPEGTWVGIEWKAGPNAEVRPEQQQLLNARRIIIAWDMATALLPLARLDEKLTGGVGLNGNLRDWATAHHCAGEHGDWGVE
jgi:hypothetical protein